MKNLLAARFQTVAETCKSFLDLYNVSHFKLHSVMLINHEYRNFVIVSFYLPQSFIYRYRIGDTARQWLIEMVK